jgi:hypothetical protein
VHATCYECVAASDSRFDLVRVVCRCRWSSLSLSLSLSVDLRRRESRHIRSLRDASCGNVLVPISQRSKTILLAPNINRRWASADYDLSLSSLVWRFWVCVSRRESHPGLIEVQLERAEGERWGEGAGTVGECRS